MISAAQEVEFVMVCVDVQRTLEVITIIVSGTQLFSTCAIHAAVESAIGQIRTWGGRV